MRRQIQIQQHQIGAGRSHVLTFASQEAERLFAVGGDVQVVRELAVSHRDLRQQDVAGVVLDKQDLHQQAPLKISPHSCPPRPTREVKSGTSSRGPARTRRGCGLRVAPLSSYIWRGQCRFQVDRVHADAER